MATSRRRPTQRAARSRPAATADEQPIVVSGPPRQLHATVTVENASDTRLSVRGPALHVEGAGPVGGSGAALVGPGATTAMPVAFALDPTTAPGTYAAELELGGIRQPAVVTVLFDVSMSVEPDTLLADPGTQEVVLVIANDGNVRMPLSPRAIARTDDGGPDPGPDVTLLLDDPGVVEPGETRTVTGRIEVPDNLEPARRHVATLPVGTADLEVIILPRAASEKKS